jgi:hypothetical protein
MKMPNNAKNMVSKDMTQAKPTRKQAALSAGKSDGSVEKSVQDPVHL